MPISPFSPRGRRCARRMPDSPTYDENQYLARLWALRLICNAGGDEGFFEIDGDVFDTDLLHWLQHGRSQPLRRRPRVLLDDEMRPPAEQEAPRADVADDFALDEDDGFDGVEIVAFDDTVDDLSGLSGGEPSVDDVREWPSLFDDEEELDAEDDELETDDQLALYRQLTDHLSDAEALTADAAPARHNAQRGGVHHHMSCRRHHQRDSGSPGVGPGGGG